MRAGVGRPLQAGEGAVGKALGREAGALGEAWRGAEGPGGNAASFPQPRPGTRAPRLLRSAAALLSTTAPTPPSLTPR